MPINAAVTIPVHGSASRSPGCQGGHNLVRVRYMLTASPADAGHFWSFCEPEPGCDASALPHISASRPSNNGERLISFIEPDESFLSQSIRNFGLTLATLGFYSFWARAEAKRQLHRSIRIGGQRLDYTGTGRESLVGFLLGTLTTVVLVSTFLHFYTKTGVTGEQARAAFADFRFQRLFVSLPLMFLLGSVVYRKRKHMLRRTWWRGQHFDLDGQPWAYAAQHFWTAFLVPLSLGWAAPWRASWLARRKIRDMHLGAHRFSAVGSVAPLYRAFAALWFGGGVLYFATMVLLGVTIGTPLLTALGTLTFAPLQQPGVISTGLGVITVGLSPVLGFILYYRAAWIEHQISSLVFNNVRLRLELPKARFAGLMLWNGFIKIISFGAFAPVADAALARFVIARIDTVAWTDATP